MNKYIKFLLVPIMLFGANNNSCYSMDNIDNYEDKNLEIGSYNEVNNNQLVPENKQLNKLTTKEKRRKKREQAIKDNARRRDNRHKKTLAKEAMQTKILRLDEELQNKYYENCEYSNNIHDLYSDLIKVIDNLSKNTLYTNQSEILKLFSRLLLKTLLYYKSLYQYVEIKNNAICNNIITESNIKNQLGEISNGKIITVGHFQYYYQNKISQQLIDMQKQVLKLMGINEDMPRDISKILQQMNKDVTLNKMELIIKDVIDPMLFKLEHLKHEIEPIVAKLIKLYGTFDNHQEFWLEDCNIECRKIKSNIKELKELLSPNKTKNDTNNNYQYNSDSNKLNKIDNEISNNIKNKNHWNDHNLIVSNQNFSVVDNKENFNKWNKTNQISKTQSLTF